MTHFKALQHCVVLWGEHTLFPACINRSSGVACHHHRRAAPPFPRHSQPPLSGINHWVSLPRTCLCIFKQTLPSKRLESHLADFAVDLSSTFNIWIGFTLCVQTRMYTLCFSASMGFIVKHVISDSVCQCALLPKYYPSLFHSIFCFCEVNVCLKTLFAIVCLVTGLYR